MGFLSPELSLPLFPGRDDAGSVISLGEGQDTVTNVISPLVIPLGKVSSSLRNPEGVRGG